MAHTDQGERNTIPALEWAMAALGLLLVVAAIGVLAYESIWGDDSPPSIRTEIQEITPVGSGYVVAVRVFNDGGTTAANLILEGALLDGAETLETSEITLDYVPAFSRREGGLFFSSDPRQHDLQLRPLGYQIP